MTRPIVRPIIVFDFEKKSVTSVGGSASMDKKLADALAAQRGLVSSASGTLRPA